MTEQTVRMTAKDLAGAFYEENVRTERFRKFWPDVKTFIARNWPSFVPMARTILVGMLADKNTPDHLKASIYEAILDDREREAGKRGVQVGHGEMMLNPKHPGAMERKLFHEQ